jgi:hypothetical protein
MLFTRITHNALGRAGLLVAFTALALVPAAASHASKKKSKHDSASSQADAARRTNYCSSTVELQEQGCLFEKKDDNFNARAICTNLLDADERAECFADATDTLREETQLCNEQSDAREDLCKSIGEARYEPDFDPAHFDDPRAPSHPNPYFPIAVGNHWSVSGGGDNVEIEVLDKVKSIDGVPCVVVNDTASDENGVPLEITDDWFAQRKDGSVMYCGENTAEYETFAGDDPQDPERVSTDGTFKAGRDGDKAGVVFPGSPRVGATYRQEWSPGNAEDAAMVLSTTYTYGHDATLDQLVPPALAGLLCSAKEPCVVTAEFSPLSPGSLEHKYFARGIGFFLATKPGSGGVEQLVGCNMDARCASLPQP